MAAALLLASVAPAFAQSSTQGGYADEGGQVQEQVSGAPGASTSDNGGNGGGQTGGDTTTTTTSSGDRTLPFTGVEVGVMLAVGVALAGLGLGLRRVTRTTA